MDQPEERTLLIAKDDLQKFKRLDAFLACSLPDMSRTLIKKIFLEGHITSSQKLELKKMPPAGTKITIILPAPAPTTIIPQDIPLDILYEDEYLLIINKPAGLVVHPAPGNFDGTLVNAILFHCHDLKGIGNEMRPGIVHRLDKGTSGIMVVAKEQKTHEGLVRLFSTHDIERKYQAICLGTKLPPKTTLESTIGRNPSNRLKMSSNVKHGKKAITHMQVLEVFSKFSHVELQLETGRTHQIRVHLCELLNSPILNDHTYGRTKEENYLLSNKIKTRLKDYSHPLLHAKLLGFIHPITQKKILFEVEPPQIFQDTLELLRQNQ
jgi:23S rRNA pseudouridine1911/1915/1917 synthase